MYVLLKNNVVIEEKVHKRDRKAPKTPLTIYYAKWNYSIVQIRSGRIER